MMAVLVEVDSFLYSQHQRVFPQISEFLKVKSVQNIHYSKLQLTFALKILKKKTFTKKLKQ